MLRNILFPMLVALPACAATPGQEEAAVNRLQCSLEGEGQAGAAASEICVLFQEAAARSGREDVHSIVLAATSKNSASLRAFAKDGTALAQLDFRIMDRPLMLSAWQDFARSFEKELAARP